MPILQCARRNAGDDVVIVHEPVNAGHRVGVGEIGEMMIAGARLAEGVKPVDRLIFFKAQAGNSNGCERCAKAMTSKP